MTKKAATPPKRPRWQSLLGTGIALLIILFAYLRTGTVPDALLEDVLGTDAATVSAILQQTAVSDDTPSAASATDTPTTVAAVKPTATKKATKSPSATPTGVQAAKEQATLTPTVTRTATRTRQPSATPTATRPPTRAPPAATPTRIRSQSGLPVILYKDLPPEAAETIRLIDNNGPFPFRQDDATFQNREGILPRQPRDWYREFTVITPGSADRGARRIIEGEDGLLFYTDDHYSSFRRGDPMRAKLRRLLADGKQTGVFRIGEEDDPAEVIAGAEALGWSAFRVDAGDVADKPAFLRGLASAMRFPAYFGQNWDAFEEIVNDPDALPEAQAYLLLLDDFALFARSQPGEWATARSILSEAAQRWHTQGRGFVVLLRNAERAAPDAPWV